LRPKERVNRFSAARAPLSEFLRLVLDQASGRLQRSEFCLRQVGGMRCPAWSMQHVFLSPAGCTLQLRKFQPGNEKKKGKNARGERYPRRLCAVSVNYAKGDSPRRLLVDVDAICTWRRTLGPLCTHSTSFQREKGRCNRVSAAGGGGGGGGDGGLDLDLASVLTCNNGRNKLYVY
ncbi:Uncharacterized protein DBV15_02477, partial [Temnothorax longispinosus]